MDFAEEPATKARLSSALSRTGGTLAFSWLNLSEFIKVDSRETAQQAEELLRAAWPNIAFIQVVPHPVIQLEDSDFKDSDQRTSILDRDIFDHYFGRALKSTSPNPWDPAGFITDMQSQALRAKTAHSRAVGLGASRRQYEIAKQRFQTEPKYQRFVRAVPKGPARRWPTKHLMEELDHAAIRGEFDLFARGNVDDLFHSIVPVAYCDLVVLDRANANRLGATLKRLRRADLVRRAARLFSRPTLTDFWRALDEWA